MSNQISLSKGLFSIVDEEDYLWLSGWKWTCSYNGYACRRESFGYTNGKRNRRIIFLHRFIMNTPNGLITDHINGDKLDNRRCNLRICTHTQNMQNLFSNRGASKYKGVYFDGINQKWVAQIVVNKKAKFLGRFDIEVEAAKAYNLAALKYFKEFKKVNIL